MFFLKVCWRIPRVLYLQKKYCYEKGFSVYFVSYWSCICNSKLFSILTVDGGALCDAEFTFSPYSTFNVKNMGVIKCKKGYTFQMPYHTEMNVVTGSIQ